MAAATSSSTSSVLTATAQMFQEHNHYINNNNNVNNNNGGGEVNREEIQAAIAKAVELRALHAALMHQGNVNSPLNLHAAAVAASSPISHHSHHFSAQDYPVFTPSYEDDPLPTYQQIRVDNRNYAESWEEYGLGGANADEILSDIRAPNTSSRKGVISNLVNLESQICPVDDQKSVTGSSANHITILRASPRANIGKSRRNSMGDMNSASSCNKFRPGTLRSETDLGTKSGKNSNIIFPLTDSHSSIHSQPRHKGLSLSWLFPRLKKKNKNESSPNRTESEEVSQILKNVTMVSIETLKRELMEANESRDAALTEAAEVKSSVGELREKLEYLETYCEDLKKALRKTSSQPTEKLGNLPTKGKCIDGDEDLNSMPVTEEVMVEGFIQIVSEARLSVKHFCKTLVGQIDETDTNLVENLNSLLQPYKLSVNSKYSKAVLYHLEAIINQTLYMDFENCVFQKNGAPKHLDPQQERESQFSSFVALRNLSWNEVLRKGTKYYSEDFSKFCDQKMSSIIATLNWTRPWPEQLLQAFFVAAKCIWLLHLLAFSFSPPLSILRIEENRTFDGHYMEDMFVDKQRSQGPSRVKIMVMPGFYVHDRVLRCKVLCRYKSVA